MTYPLTEGTPVSDEITLPKPQEMAVDLEIARLAVQRLQELLKGNSDPNVAYNLGLLTKALKGSRKSRKPKA